MGTVPKDYVNVKVTEETREVLRMLYGVTGETFNSIIQRLAIQEYNRLSGQGGIPKTIKESKAEYNVHRPRNSEK